MACNAQCKKVASRETFELEAIIGRAKSQKPSEVGGEFGNSKTNEYEAGNKQKGLITPIDYESQHVKRLQKIRNMAKKFRERRQQNIGLLANNNCQKR